MSMTNAVPAPRGADETIGDRVHQLMWLHKVTQTALAPTLGFTQSALSAKLRGRRGWSADDLLKVSRHFGVSIDYLFGEEPEGPKVLPTDYTYAGSNEVIDLRTRRAI